MIEIKNLHKSYGKIQAIKGIDITINEGEFYGLLGPNGAGKTTTINILSTILKPDKGDVFINGIDLKTESKKCKNFIGIVPQEIALYDDLSAYDNLVFWGKLYKINCSLLSKRINELLDLMGLEQRKNHKIKTFSGGMKRRINIACALLHSPKILLMDEPTVGVDPQSRNFIFEALQKLHQQGTTIIYTTHYMEEVEKLCDKISIIDYGKIIAQGSINELKKLSKISESIIIHSDSELKNKTEIISNSIENKFDVSDDFIKFYCKNINSDLSKIINKLNAIGINITNIELKKTNLETLFLELTGRKLRD
ncbi:MAG: ABC transporter ATP-binding protein [Bacteroidales bacterium]|nr:ABC transporter ATP-binding protein [Bacteroidales bacterium]